MAYGSGAIGNGTCLLSSRYGPSVSAIAIEGRVVNKSEPARTGAMAEKCGTQPAIFRFNPAVEAARFTGLVRLSPTRTARWGHCDQLLRPNPENAGCRWRPKQCHCSVP